MKKIMVIQNPMFSNPKFPCDAAPHSRFWLSTFLGLEFGFWMVKLWSLLVVAKN
jgi:hypothetical protein